MWCGRSFHTRFSENWKSRIFDRQIPILLLTSKPCPKIWPNWCVWMGVSQVVSEAFCAPSFDTNRWIQRHTLILCDSMRSHQHIKRTHNSPIYTNFMKWQVHKQLLLPVDHKSRRPLFQKAARPAVSDATKRPKEGRWDRTSHWESHRASSPIYIIILWAHLFIRVLFWVSVLLLLLSSSSSLSKFLQFPFRFLMFLSVCFVFPFDCVWYMCIIHKCAAMVRPPKRAHKTSPLSSTLFM